MKTLLIMVESDGSGCISKLWDFGTLPAPVLFTISALFKGLQWSLLLQVVPARFENPHLSEQPQRCTGCYGCWHFWGATLVSWIFGLQNAAFGCKSFQIFDEQLGTKLFGCQIRKTYVLGDGGNPVCTSDLWFAGIEEKGTKCISSERRRIMPTLGFCGRNYEGSRVSFVPPYRRLMHQKIDATLGLSLFFWGSLFVEPKEVTILDHTNPWLPVTADDPQHSSEAIGTCFA